MLSLLLAERSAHLTKAPVVHFRVDIIFHTRPVQTFSHEIGQVSIAVAAF